MKVGTKLEEKIRVQESVIEDLKQQLKFLKFLENYSESDLNAADSSDDDQEFDSPCRGYCNYPFYAEGKPRYNELTKGK